jgi:tRNA(fMet)-specific endonuclease VapC
VTLMLKQFRATTGDRHAVISAVGLTELIHGIYRAPTGQIRTRREAFIRELLDAVEVYPFTKQIALLAGEIDGEQRNLGIVIPFVDLLIDATALQFGYSLLTGNARHFKLTPGLTVTRL